MENSKNNNSTPSSRGFCDLPENSFETVNKYGTYEIQPTADTPNLFPAVAQGLPKQRSEKNKKHNKTNSALCNSKNLWE